MERVTVDEPRHPIRVVARRTGLTPAVLRAWERRYGAVTPSRTAGGQRLYSDGDVRRLTLLHRLVEEGRSIGQVAGLSLGEIEALVLEDDARRVVPFQNVDAGAGQTAAGTLESAFRAVEELDPSGLQRSLTRAVLSLPVSSILEDLLVPLLSRIGSSWSQGLWGPAHEHVATVVIRRFLERLVEESEAEADAPMLVAGTPRGERHELGALMCAVAAVAEGWRGVYVGPDLPAAEIATAAVRMRASVVALSMVDPGIGKDVAQEIGRLRKGLPREMRLVVGGPVADAKIAELRTEGVTVLGSLQDLRRVLISAPGEA